MHPMHKVPKARWESGFNELAIPRNTIAVTSMAISLCKGGAGVKIGCCVLSIVVIVKNEVGKVGNIALAVISILFLEVFTRAANTGILTTRSRCTRSNM